jgi:Zn-finger nucleic acid-binding protein
MTDRQGVEIDYCPQCRGIWLDKGELDKIIEKSAAAERSPSVSTNEGQATIAQKPSFGSYQTQNNHDGHGQDIGVDGHHGSTTKKKRGGFLGDLLDFGD